MRLLGCYDNLWLSHADRAHVLSDEARQRWAGANGGIAHTVFVDGFMAGLWRVRDARVDVVELFRRLSRAERADLDTEVGRVETFLGR